MTIRFKCPGCQKTLGVKDHLAGKKANCPVCKRPFVIPKPKRGTPTSKPANVEDFAAQALADKPAPEEQKQAPTTIDFPCDWCGEDIKFGLEEAGKQVPCPHCRRIVKVPRPKVEAKKNDWRAPQANDKPAWARENAAQQTLVGATTKGTVSGEALREAGAIEEPEDEPLSTEQKVGFWLRRLAIAILVVGLLAGAWYGASVNRSNKVQSTEVNLTLDVLKTKLPLSPEWQAELHRALGEFYLHKNSKKDRDEALNHFHKSLAALRNPEGKGAHSPEREIALIELALSMIELGGTPDQVLEKKRLDWKEDMLKELQRPLQAIPSTDGRILALREVGAKLLDKGQGPMALALATQLCGESERVGGFAQQGQRSPLAGQQVAFLFALKQDGQAAKELPLPKKEEVPLDLPTRLGHAEGKARQGDLAGARKLAFQKGPPLHQLQALAGVALIASQQDQMSDARTTLDEAVKVLQGMPKAIKAPPLTLLTLARVALRCEAGPSFTSLKAALSDAGCAAQLELALLQQRAKNDPKAADPGELKEKYEKSLAYAQAVEAVARFKTRTGRRTEALEALESADEPVRPFIHAGVALGEQDRQ